MAEKTQQPEGGRAVTYRVNSPNVISETMGGETIIVNLASGHYFSLQGRGQRLGGSGARETKRRWSCSISGRYEAGDGDIAAAVRSLSRDFVRRSSSSPRRRGSGRAARGLVAGRGSRRPSWPPASRSSPTCRTSFCSTPSMRSTRAAGRMHSAGSVDSRRSTSTAPSCELRAELRAGGRGRRAGRALTIESPAAACVRLRRPALTDISAARSST